MCFFPLSGSDKEIPGGSAFRKQPESARFSSVQRGASTAEIKVSFPVPRLGDVCALSPRLGQGQAGEAERWVASRRGAEPRAGASQPARTLPVRRPLRGDEDQETHTADAGGMGHGG